MVGLLMEYVHFPIKQKFRSGLVDFGSVGGEDLDEAGEMRSPCRSETPATTYIIFLIYAQLHLYMENMS